MKHATHFGLAAAVLAGAAGPGLGDSANHRSFSVARAIFEQNATDGDTEVVFTIQGGEDGLEELTVIAPNGRTVIQFSCPRPNALGMRQFRFESPEPTDRDALAADFPEGPYAVHGKSVKGVEFAGTAHLNHTLPPVTTFLHPAPDAEVAAENLRVAWTSVPGVAGYELEIEQEESDVNLSVRLPASADSFVLPEGFLKPGLEYTLAIATRTADGNLSFIEESFTTAEP